MCSNIMRMNPATIVVMLITGIRDPGYSKDDCVCVRFGCTLGFTVISDVF